MNRSGEIKSWDKRDDDGLVAKFGILVVHQLQAEAHVGATFRPVVQRRLPQPVKDGGDELQGGESTAVKRGVVHRPDIEIYGWYVGCFENVIATCERQSEIDGGVPVAVCTHNATRNGKPSGLAVDGHQDVGVGQHIAVSYDQSRTVVRG